MLDAFYKLQGINDHSSANKLLTSKNKIWLFVLENILGFFLCVFYFLRSKRMIL